MSNIFLFIRRYIILLLFLAGQGFAVWMLTRYNRHHRAIAQGMSQEITGRINEQVDKVDDYFHLREENRRIHRMNDSLLNLRPQNFAPPDTGLLIVQDTLRVDTVGTVRRYRYRDAKVVQNSVTLPNNYLQISRGANGGVRDNMAVINSNGALVGLVVATSPNFAQVMSLLHRNSTVPAMLKSGQGSGTVRWDGKDPRYLQLEGIGKEVPVKKGDTVLISRYSYNFPPGALIGQVSRIDVDPASGFYKLQVTSAARFNTIQHVFVVENLQRDEQVRLDSAAKRRVEQKGGAPK